VAGIANNETEVVPFRENDTSLNVGWCLGHDDEPREVTDRAIRRWIRGGRCGGWARRRIAGETSPKCPDIRDGLVGAINIRKYEEEVNKSEGTYCHCGLPQLLVTSAHLAELYVGRLLNPPV
jgi:hypothetical protein